MSTTSATTTRPSEASAKPVEPVARPSLPTYEVHPLADIFPRLWARQAIAMSRFTLIGAQECVVGGMRRRLKAGTTVADSAANAQAGDVLSPQLCSSPNVR